MENVAKIYLEEKDKKRLNNRTCVNCGNKLKRNKTECWEFWINRMCCCSKCRDEDRRENGIRNSKNEYKVYDCSRECYVITIPKRIAEKFNLKGKRYEIKKVNDKIVIYKKEGDGRYRARVITRINGREYYALTIPKKYVAKYNLYNAIFKCEVDSDNIIAYTKL